VKRIAAWMVYFGRTAVRGIGASPLTSAVAVATIAISLLLVGAFALLLSNMRELLDDFGDALQVTAYLEDALPADERERLASVARTIEGVESVRIVSKEEALERFQQGVGRGSALLDGLSENPLPAALELTLAPAWRSAAGLERVAGSLDGLGGISDLSSGHDWVEGYLRAVSLVRGVSIGLGAILGFAALLIVANTIRLAILSRRDELEILALVGASRIFVDTPFVLEGAIQGAAGGTLALVLLYGLFRLVLPGFEFGLEMLLGGVAPQFFSLSGCALLIAAGAGLGLVGSVAALVGERPV
jgi:cell division transport system permease protein